MASEVDIANLALYRAGSTIRITSLNESVERTEAVRQAGFLYPLARDQVLQSAPWGCARKSVALALVNDGTSYPGYAYVYQYPANCIQFLTVCDAGGMRASNVWMAWWNTLTNSDISLSVPKVPFQIGTNAAGDANVIMTDIPNAYGFYIFRQTKTATYSPLLVDAIAYKMGGDLGGALNTNANRVQRCINMYEPTLARAMAQMMNEAQQDAERDSPSIQARQW